MQSVTILECILAACATCFHTGRTGQCGTCLTLHVYTFVLDKVEGITRGTHVAVSDMSYYFKHTLYRASASIVSFNHLL